MQQHFRIENQKATLYLNRELYPKEVIIQACYVKLEEFYFLIDADDQYFYVYLQPKQQLTEEKLRQAAYDFFEELIESQSYLDQLKRTKEIRQTILERALLTQQDERYKNLEEDPRNQNS